MPAPTEQVVLGRSVTATVVVGATGIVFGILTGSLSIAFDGMFSAVDASMTLLSLFVARLIAREASARFQLGYWHLEPLVLVLNGALLTTLTIYAFVNAVTALLTGGRELVFDRAIVYAAIVVAICLAMFLYERRANREIGSEFIALDVRGWAMSGLITAALLVAFTIAFFLEDGPYEPWTPYVDPAILAVLTLAILPMPLRIVLEALKDIFLIAPRELDERVRRVAAAAVERHGYAGVRTYVAKVGRSRLIELHFIVPADHPQQRVADFDRVREELSEEIGGRPRDRWLTIVFTGDVRWAD